VKRFILPIAKQRSFTAQRYLRSRFGLERSFKLFIKVQLTHLYYDFAMAKVLFNYGVVRLGTLIFGAVE